MIQVCILKLRSRILLQLVGKRYSFSIVLVKLVEFKAWSYWWLLLLLYRLILPENKANTEKNRAKRRRYSAEEIIGTL